MRRGRGGGGGRVEGVEGGGARGAAAGSMDLRCNKKPLPQT